MCCCFGFWLFTNKKNKSHNNYYYLETRNMSPDCNHCNKSMKLSFCPFSAFLFASSAAAYTGYLARKAKKTNEKKFDVVFILGGPVRIFAYSLVKVPTSNLSTFLTNTYIHRVQAKELSVSYCPR